MDKEPPKKIEDNQYTLNEILIGSILANELKRRCKLHNVDYSGCQSLDDFINILDKYNAFEPS